MLPPSSEYGACPCSGRYERRTVEVRIHADSDVILLEDVPQGACLECGSRVYKADILDDLETLHGGWPIRVPAHFG